jgi:hypothetical protein
MILKQEEKMTQVQKIFDKLMQMPLNDLLMACSMALESGMDSKRIDIPFLALEARLQKRRMLIKLGLDEKPTEKT